MAAPRQPVLTDELARLYRKAAARESWAYEPLAQLLSTLPAEEVELQLRGLEVPVTVIGLERFLAEPEALWLLAALSCHPSPFVRAAALTHLAELDGEGWALDYARLRSQDAEPRVRAAALAWLDRAAPSDARN